MVEKSGMRFFPVILMAFLSIPLSLFARARGSYVAALEALEKGDRMQAREQLELAQKGKGDPEIPDLASLQLIRLSILEGAAPEDIAELLKKIRNGERKQRGWSLALLTAGRAGNLSLTREIAFSCLSAGGIPPEMCLLSGGRGLILAGDLTTALEFFQKLLLDHPDSPLCLDALYYTGEIYGTEGFLYNPVKKIRYFEEYYYRSQKNPAWNSRWKSSVYQVLFDRGGIQRRSPG